MTSRLSLTFSLAKRSVLSRYKGSILGVFWTLLTPLFLLAVYTFVFGSIFKSRWPQTDGGTSQEEFAIILFSGLILFQLFSEVINSAPSIMLANANYVKKVVFPLEILVPVSLLAALFHLTVSLIVLLIAMVIIQSSIHLTALLLPVVVLPFCMLTLGLAWFLASLGVYIRDIGQIIGTIVTAMLFVAPIFFPLSAMPQWIQPLVKLNPITIPVEATRDLIIFGRIPDLISILGYSLFAACICAGGYYWFQKTRKGFADVL